MVEIYRAASKKAKKSSPKKAKSPTVQFRKKVYRAIGKTTNPLSAFVARPKKINFENQLDGEEILLLLRRHPITQIKWVLITIAMILAPLVLTQFPLIDFLPGRFRFITILMWFLLTLAFIMESFLSWYFNVNIITDERVIDIDFYNLIYKEISDAEIENIEDVTLIQGGVWQTLFNYGLVIIQTAAETPQFEFKDIPNPSLVVNVLKNMQLEEKQEVLEGRIK